MSPEESPGQTDYPALTARMGYGALKRRLKKQAKLWAKETHQGTGIFAVEAWVPVNALIRTCLRLTGLYGPGLANYLDIQVLENEAVIPGLPRAFDGFRLLQLADLHCDLHEPFADVVVEKLQGLVYDAAAFTGDYHNKIATSAETSLRLMTKIVSAVHGPRLGILGNHDFIEKVAYLEHIGLPILLNESTFLERNGERLYFAGVDDPHYFRSEDLVRARAGIPAGVACVLLSHSPEPYREAARLGYSFMICGHTHGGQICLPGGWPIIRNTRSPRRLLFGPWRHEEMIGYTSRGTGACGVPARFFCPPEITIHTLRAGPAPGTSLGS